MVSVLAIRSKGRGFNPGRGDGFLRAIKNPQHAFLRRGSTRRAHVIRLYGTLKTYTNMKGIFVDKNHHFLRPYSPDLILDCSAVRISRELWWTNKEFSL
jgi:hypothetical protein